MTLREFLSSGNGAWFPTRKKRYRAEAMMVSRPFSFRNEFEEADYTAEDDGETVVLRGTRGEMWTAAFPKVAKTYRRPDGSEVTPADFAEKDVWIRLETIPAGDTNFAMFVPRENRLTAETSGGTVLTANGENAPHGAGDYLVCSARDGKPDLSGVWVVNGTVFPAIYDMSRRSR